MNKRKAKKGFFVIQIPHRRRLDENENVGQCVVTAFTVAMDTTITKNVLIEFDTGGGGGSSSAGSVFIERIARHESISQEKRYQRPHSLCVPCLCARFSIIEF